MSDPVLRLGDAVPELRKILVFHPVQLFPRVGQIRFAVRDFSPRVGGGAVKAGGGHSVEQVLHPVRHGFGVVPVSVVEGGGRVLQGDIRLCVRFRGERRGVQDHEAGDAARAEVGRAALVVQIERREAEARHGERLPGEILRTVLGQDKFSADHGFREKAAVHGALPVVLRQTSRSQQRAVDLLRQGVEFGDGSGSVLRQVLRVAGIGALRFRYGRIIHQCFLRLVVKAYGGEEAVVEQILTPEIPGCGLRHIVPADAEPGEKTYAQSHDGGQGEIPSRRGSDLPEEGDKGQGFFSLSHSPLLTTRSLPPVSGKG